MKKIYFAFVLIFIANACIFGQVCPLYTYTKWPPRFRPAECSNIKPCGIYLIAHVHNAGSTNYQANSQYYDGIFIDLRWNELETSSGYFDQTTGNAWHQTKEIIQFAADNGKQVSIGVQAGENTPEWVMNNLTTPKIQCSLNGVSAKNIKGFGGSWCEELANVACPWDPYFKDSYKSMIYLLRTELTNATLLNGNSLIKYVVMIKLCGVNMNSVETRLPVEDWSFNNNLNSSFPNCGTCASTVCTTGYYFATDMIAFWTQQGADYTPQKVVDAWQDIASYTQGIFSDKYVNLVVLPNARAFPPIDCYGHAIGGPLSACPPMGAFLQNSVVDCAGTTYNGYKTLVNPATPAYHIYDYNVPGPQPTTNLCHFRVTDELVYRTAVSWQSQCVAVNSTYLGPNQNSAYLDGEYPQLKDYSMIGYQMEHVDNPNWWSGTDFIAAINYGLAGYASFIEIHANEIDHYAHELVPPGPGYVYYMDWAYDIVHCRCVNPGCRLQSIPDESESDNNLTVTTNEYEIHFSNKGRAQNCHITVYDMLGKNVAEKDFIANTGESSLSKNDFKIAPSNYFFKIDFGGNSKILKLFYK